MNSSPPIDDGHSKNALRSWLQLLKFSKRMEQRSNSRFVSDFNSSLSRFDVLANLHLAPGHHVSTTQLARMLLASKGNITRLLDRMENDGLIRRQINSQDKRVSEVFFTKAGRNLFEEMAAQHEHWTSEVFKVLSNQELKQLIDLVIKLRSRMDAGY